MSFKSFAEYYHDETKYSPEGLTKNQRHLDWSKQPEPFKEYIKGEKISLGQYIAGKKEFETEEDLNLQKLSKILYYTNGITAMVPYATPLLLRASPSAGGLYPTEIYVVTNGFKGLDDGVYNFQVKNHSLVQFWDKSIWSKLKEACFNNGYFDNSNIAIIYTCVFFRSSWRYQERAYRRILLDTGHVIGNTEIYSSFQGKQTNLIGAFHDDAIADLLWLNKEEEGVLAVALLSDSLLEKDNNSVLPSLIKKPSSEDNILISLHNSSKINSFQETKLLKGSKETVITKPKLNFTVGEPLPEVTIDWENKLTETIKERRSTRYFTSEPIKKEEIAKILSFAYHPEKYQDQGFSPKSDLMDASIIETYIAITDVDGLEDGCYYYSPNKNELRQIRFKNFREEIYYLCLGQELGRDAGAVIFHTVNLPEAVEKYGERAYRYLHLDAGILGERLNLACLKIGLGVSGIGGFFDDQVNDLLGIPESQAVLYITVVGKPFKESGED